MPGGAAGAGAARREPRPARRSPTRRPSSSPPPSPRSSKAFGKLKLSTLARKSRFTLSFNAPAKGTVKLRLTAKAKKKTVVVGSGSRSVAAAGTTKVTVKLTKAGRTLLKRSKRLKVTLAGSFTPVGAGAKPIERTTSVTLKK